MFVRQRTICRSLIQMVSRRTPWQLIALATVFGLTHACSGGGSDDSSRAGSSNAGSMGAVGGASGGSSGTAGQAAAVDCEAVCAHVKMLCADRTDINDVWLSACKSSCDARVQLTPNTALLEQACVQAAATCNASVICVATPG